MVLKCVVATIVLKLPKSNNSSVFNCFIFSETIEIKAQHKIMIYRHSQMTNTTSHLLRRLLLPARDKLGRFAIFFATTKKQDVLGHAIVVIV